VYKEQDGDAISKQAVNTLVDELARAISDERCCVSRGRSTATIMQDILELPSLTPQPKMGRWVPLEYDGYADGNPVWDKWECSRCGWEHSGDEESLTAFCPNCGAKMEREDGEQ
jgi:rubrerythrin